MSKVRINKVAYVLIIFMGVLSVFLIYREITPPYNFIFLIVAMLLLLIPGRIVGHYYKDFFTGRKLLNAKNYEKSIEYNSRFLKLIENKPWIKKLMWFSWGMYTRDIEAMTYNNIGTGLLYSAKFNQSKEYFERALSVDKNYPLPYFNLAILCIINGDTEAARSNFKEAEKRGYKGTSFDRLVTQLQGLYANIEGEKK